MVYLRNRLADYELSIARYYMTRGAYVGAINRARGLIEGYDGAPAVQRSLALMAEAYRKLDMEDLAQVAEQVSVKNDVPDLVNPVAGTAGLATSPESAGGLGSGAAYREGRWEGRAGLVAANSADVDFEGGTTAEIEGGTGFLIGVAYHYNDRLQFGSTFTYDQKDYSADVVGDEPGETYAIKGDLDSMTLMFDAAYNFLTGPLTPFVSAGVGWSWVDTNVATAPPEIGCWWHPWWGYVCTSFQDTQTFDGLAYELGLGVRYDFNDVLAADGSYKMKWVDYSNATDTPSFDGFQLNIIWKF
jgi:opacity protein-like surface antigen